MRDKIIESFETYFKKGSNWRLHHVVRLDIRVDEYTPMVGSSYIPTPKALVAKKAIINVQNVNDDECFMWAVTVASIPKHVNSERLSNALREHSKMFDWTDIRFPTPLEDIKKFAKKNNVEINVFGYEDGNVYPLFILGTSKKTIDLLYLKEIDDERSVTNVKTHYVWIKNMSRL